MTLLYNSIRGLILTTIAGIAMVFVNKEIADIIFIIQRLFILSGGISLVLLVVKNVNPKGASKRSKSPYTAQNRHKSSENITMREQIAQSSNSYPHSNCINDSYKNRQDCKKCFISLHDIFLPPTVCLIIKRIIKSNAGGSNLD